MFGHELLSSFFLLFFAALLCLFGLGMLIDGIIRLFGGLYKSSPTVANGNEEERANTHQQAA
jgi:hypothetical protein